MSKLWKQAEKNQVERDPSLLSQLAQIRGADPLNRPLQLQSYLEACQKAPGASEKTKRKWRKHLGV